MTAEPTTEAAEPVDSPGRGASRLVETLRHDVLPLLWRARLSWLRIALALYYGGELVAYIRGWGRETPDLPVHGWVLTLIPAELREAILSQGELVTVLVLVLEALVVLGIATRPALVMLALIGLFVHSVKASDGTFEHSASLSTQVLFALAFVPGTNAVSVERLVRWWRAGRPDIWTFLGAPYRKWGEYLILAILAITYTTSGLSKLRFGGLGWMDGETLGFYLRGMTVGGTPVYLIGGGETTWRDDFGLEMYTYGNYRYGGYSTYFAPVVDWIGHTSAVLIAISVATVLLEISGLLLFVPRLRSVLLIGYICMHMMIGLLMGLQFTEYRIICLFLIEWQLAGPLLVRAWNAVRPPPAAATV